MSCTVGKLSCLAVVHLIASMNGSNRIDDQAVSWDLCNALKYVEKMEMQSIALPAIGAGNHFGDFMNLYRKSRYG